MKCFLYVCFRILELLCSGCSIMFNFEISKLKLRVVVENSVYRSGFWASHGLSIFLDLIDSDGDSYKVLFDTGNEGGVLIHNLERMKIDIDDLDAIVISHGHYDHTGGLPKLAEVLGSKKPLFMHPDALNEKFAFRKKLRYIGNPFSAAFLEEYFHVILTSGPAQVVNSVYVTGEIQRDERYCSTSGFYQKVNGDLKPDPIKDDIALVINMENNESVVITGCGHSGAANIVQHVLNTFKPEKITALIGGLHLEWVPVEVREANWEKLRELPIKYFSPMHCSGPTIVSYVIKEFSEKYLMLHTGDEFTFSPL